MFREVTLRKVSRSGAVALDVSYLEHYDQFTYMCSDLIVSRLFSAR